MIHRIVLMLALICSLSAVSQNPAPAFQGVDQWKGALVASDATSLKNLYSSNPPAKFIGADHKPAPDISPEIDFWQKLITSGASDLEVSSLGEQDQQGMHIVNLSVAMKVKTDAGPRTRYVNEQQAWQPQGDKWMIVLVTHSEPTKMAPALKPNPNLYHKDADAKVEIRDALAKAAKGHQRVILVFGGNWCYDCHVLDQAFHQADIAPIVDKNFQVVHVDIGDDPAKKKNFDLAEQYKVVLDKGVPALAILESDGKVVFSQQNGEWESARSLDPDDVIAFLNKWKP